MSALPGSVATVSKTVIFIYFASTTSLAYDCDGNVITGAVGSTYSLGCDQENHLTGSAPPNSSRVGT